MYIKTTLYGKKITEPRKHGCSMLGVRAETLELRNNSERLHLFHFLHLFPKNSLMFRQMSSHYICSKTAFEKGACIIYIYIFSMLLQTGRHSSFFGLNIFFVIHD